jgi:hypothetical protein
MKHCPRIFISMFFCMMTIACDERKNGSLAPSESSGRKILFQDSFDYPDGLITNEFTYRNPNDVGVRSSPLWELTSGSLFAHHHVGWTGIPDGGDTEKLSEKFTNSAVFRLTTKQQNFGDVIVDFGLLNKGLTSTNKTPEVAWDGVHVFLRYQSQYNLYYASVNRRDNTVVIKKKIPGGPSNDGTYYDLSRYNLNSVPYNLWQKVSALIRNESDGSVTIELSVDGRLVVAANDNGSVGGPPIRLPGKVGIRGDNAELEFKDFKVISIF